MNRVRPVEALLAALATLAVTLPLTTLFTPATWLRPSVLLVAVVALAGMGLRRVTANRPLVVVGQCALLVYATALLHGRGHLFADLLPTPETGQALGILLQEAQSTVTNYTAPAPSNRATILAISLLIGLTAARGRRDRGDVPQPGAGRHPPAVGVPRVGDQLRRRPGRLVRRAGRPGLARPHRAAGA